MDEIKTNDFQEVENSTVDVLRKFTKLKGECNTWARLK